MRLIVALAYDSGGVTTSTVSTPLVQPWDSVFPTIVLGLSPLRDGFGLVAFASLVPIITIIGYAQLTEWNARHGSR